jgi:hypothetical protein
VASGIQSLSGGDGIDPASIGDNDTLSVAPGNFAGTGLVDDGASNLEVAWGDANGLDAAGAVDAGAVDSAAIQSGAVGTDELAQSGASDGHVFRWNGTSWETGFPGTTGDVPLELEGFGETLLELDPNGTDDPNVMAGNPNNTLNNSPQGATIAGGGDPADVNAVGADYGAVGGGLNNEVNGQSGTVAGGRNNTTGGGAGNAVGGGDGNTANGPFAAIGGGNGNSTDGQEATVAGGRDNKASAARSTVGGGSTNEAIESGATIAGGKFNDVSGLNAVVSGGSSNAASGDSAAIGGGQDNTATGPVATVPGGRYGAAENGNSFVWNDGMGYHSIPNSTADGLSSSTAVNGEPVTGQNTFSASATSGFRFITGPSSVTYIDGDGTLTLDTTTNAIQSPAGNSLVFETDGGERTLQLGPPKSGGAFIGGGNLVAGHPDNTVNNDAVGVVIGGGGASGNAHTVGANYGTVGGGLENTASGKWATVGGGRGNTAGGQNATVGGGRDNEATDRKATVGGGEGNTASNFGATVGGGDENTASGAVATVPGGRYGGAESSNTFVWNDGTEYHAIPNTSFDGLSSNIAVKSEPVTGQNTFSASAVNGFRFITGGDSSPNVTYIDSDGTLTLDTATNGIRAPAGDSLTFETDNVFRTLELGPPGSSGAFTAGGNVLAGHPDNTVNNSAVGVAIGGGGASSGNEHTVGANYGTVSGGFNNEVSGENGTVGGGSDNTASGENGTVGGGEANTVSGDGASVPGGRQGAAESIGAFVWNDGSGYHPIPNTSSDGLSSDTAVDSEPVTGGLTFSVSATNGARFITGTSSSPTVTYITSSSGGWTTTSSRAAKTNIDPVDPGEALAGVNSMEIATWEYTGEDGEGAGTTHIGPMAEEFHEAFDVGPSEEHINSINADGVALAAIQGLSTELDEREGRIEDLEAENERLREHNADLEARLDAVEAQLGLDGGAATQGVADD